MKEAVAILLVLVQTKKGVDNFHVHKPMAYKPSREGYNSGTSYENNIKRGLS